MPSYLEDEASVANSAPVELFKFAGTYAMYAYTSGPKDIDFDDGNGVLTYQAIAVERTEVKVGTQDDDSTDLTVKMSVLQQLVIDYGFTTSPPDLTLTIYRVQPNGFAVYWHGPVTNISVDDKARASLNCPSSLGAALVGNVPNVYYQTPCNNVLYDVRCKVDYAANSYATTVSAVSANGKTVTIGGIGALDGKLIGGELALGTGEIRMITAQVGDDLTVNFPFNTIDVGGACVIAAGCDHMYRGDCKNKFANQLNFNGFMFIPPDNPFTVGIDPAKNGVTDDACVFEHIFSGDWGVLEFVTNFGPNVPVMGPWSWFITLKRGGVTQATIDQSFGSPYNVYDGGSTAHGDPPPYDYLQGWVSKFIKGTHYPTDPFAAGDPDTMHLSIQWPYSDYIFPGDSTFGGDHGDMQVTLLLPSGLIFTTPVFSGIIGLWPQDWEWAI